MYEDGEEVVPTAQEQREAHQLWRESVARMVKETDDGKEQASEA